MAAEDADLTPSRPWAELIEGSRRRGTYLRRRRRAMTSAPLVALAVAALGVSLTGPDDRPQKLEITEEPSASPSAAPDDEASHAPALGSPTAVPRALATPGRSQGSGPPRPGSTGGSARQTPAPGGVVAPDPGNGLGSRRIVFYSYRDGDFDLYAMDGDGENVIQLTNEPGTQFMPSWSPDGRQIAYTSSASGETPSGLFVMNADGSGKRRLTTVRCEATQRAPCEEHVSTWSPDGRTIVFDRGDPSRDCDVSGDCTTMWRVDVDGSGLRSLGTGSAPRFSPDGKLVLFYDFASPSDRSGCAPTSDTFYCFGELYTMRPDGSERRALGVPGGEPSWSPDGQRIVFTRQIGQVSDVHVYDVTTGDTTRLTYSAEGGNTGGGDFSPDGRSIVYHNYVESNYDLFIMRADGSGQRPLLESAGADLFPRFAPT